MQATTFTRSIKLATLATAIALSGMAATAVAAGSPATEPAASAAAGAQADPAATPCGKSGRHHGHHGKHARATMGSSAFFIPGYGAISSAVVDSLSLTESQAKLVQVARDAQKASMSSRRDTMKSMKTARVEQLKTGKLDPKAALKQADEARSKAFEGRSKLNENWLAVWDALDATQQEKVSTYLVERAEKRAQQHTRGHHGGKSGKMAS